MKHIKILFMAVMLILFSSIGIKNVSAATKLSKTNIYIEVGETYTQKVTSSKPVLDAYDAEDKKIATATWNDSALDKRTKFDIKGIAPGTTTFYVCKNGEAKEANRVRIVKVHVYSKASATTLTATNSTSQTNGSYDNVAVYLYTGKTSKLTLSQNKSFPTNVSEDTSGKAKALSKSFGTDDKAIATVDSDGKITAVKQGTAKITATRQWTTSNGTVKAIKRTITVYIRTLPKISIYEGTRLISGSQNVYMNKTLPLTYKVDNKQATDTVKSASFTSADTSKFTITAKDGTYTVNPKTLTNGTPVNVIVKIILNSAVSEHNGADAATFTQSIPIYILEDKNVYVTSVSFDETKVTVIKGDSYKQTATVLPSNATNKKVTYTSSNTAVASVDEQGNVSTKKCGDTTITAKSEMVSSKSGTYKVTVISPGTNITGASSVEGGIKVKWKAIDGSNQYKLYRSKNKVDYTCIKTLSGTDYTDNTAEFGQDYYYKVVVVPTEGETYKSGDSNVRMAKRTLEVPQGVNASVTSNGIKIIYQVVDEAESYNIYRSADNVSFKKIGNSEGNTYIDYSADYGQNYYYKVKAVASVNGKNFESAYSNAKSAKRTVTVPTNVKITTVNGNIVITWNAVNSAKSYNVYRSADNVTFTKISSPIENKYIDQSAEYGQTYYYKIKTVATANNKSFKSAYSNMAQMTMELSVPSIKSVKLVNGQYRVSISECNCDGYVIYAGCDAYKVQLASTTSQAATVSLDAGTYNLYVKSYVNVNNRRVYSKYSKKYKYTSKQSTLAENYGSKIKISKTVKKLKYKKVARQNNKVVVSIKNRDGANCIQYQFSKKQNFGSPVTRISTKGKITLKGNNKNYVRVRAIKVINGQMYYSAWTKKKIG